MWKLHLFRASSLGETYIWCAVALTSELRYTGCSHRSRWERQATQDLVLLLPTATSAEVTPWVQQVAYPKDMQPCQGSFLCLSLSPIFLSPLSLLCLSPPLSPFPLSFSSVSLSLPSLSYPPPATRVAMAGFSLFTGRPHIHFRALKSCLHFFTEVGDKVLSC